MGTRSLTHVMENGKPLLTIYRQMDGYPSGHGADLQEFLVGMKIGNGIPVGIDRSKFANGMGCLAATVVKNLKAEAGGIYIYPAGSTDCGEEYVYTLSDKDGALQLNLKGYNDTVLYDGPFDQFYPAAIEE